MIILKKIWKYIMSLFDISKDDKFRRLPQPNSNDLVNNRLAHGTTQNHQAGEETSPDGLKFRERQLLAQQDGDNKAVFGFLESTNSFGLKVAKAGYDVLTADDSQLIFNSEQNVFKIVQSGTLVTSELIIAAPGAGNYSTGSVTDTVAHNLGYKPSFLLFSNSGTTQFNVPLTLISSSSSSTAVWTTVNAYVDDVGLNVITTIMVYGIGITRTAREVKYYLLQETAN